MKRSFQLPGNQFRRSLSTPLLVATTLLLVVLYPSGVRAQDGGERTFSSPGVAVMALYKAVKASDSETMNAIFGSNAGKILRSGDDVADKNLQSNFVKYFEQMHRVVIEPDQTSTLYIGPDNWPFPIKLQKNTSGAWYFNTEDGAKEIMYRRIGRNENQAADTLHALVDAQKEYAATTHDDDKVKHYAVKLMSDEGKHDGLYWKTSGSEPVSPIGPFLAGAADAGYSRNAQPTPFYGYMFKLLTKQGPDAKGGARDYTVNGKLSRGFAILAYPAEYRSTGVMTFIISSDNVVYEKDLGPDTAKLAAAMDQYNPDKSWDPAD